MQTDVQKYVKNKTKLRAGRSLDDIENYKKAQLAEFQSIIDSQNPYVRPPQVGKLIETLKDDVLGRAFVMGPIHTEA